MKSRTAQIWAYARVSTDDQSIDMQTLALSRHGYDRLITETASAWRGRRREFDNMLRRMRRGDTLLVWKLDRLGRNLRELLRVTDWLQAEGVQLVSLSEAIDTATPIGKLYFGIMAVIAQFESDQTSMRTKAGIEARRAKGLPIGRAPKLTPAQIKAAARDLRTTRAPLADVAKKYGVAQSTLSKALPGYRTQLRAAGEYPPKRPRELNE